MAWDNYATICRLCLQHDGFLLGIFNNHAHVHDDKSIQKKIIECTTLELSSGDGLPPCICHRCLYKVELCIEFKKQCLLSDATLRQISIQSEKNHRIQRHQPESEEIPYKPKVVDVAQFEEFARENQQFIADYGQNVENVVMVVNPDLEYESDGETECDYHSDVETNDTPDFTELRNVFMCKYCDRAYTEQDECEKHEQTEHNNEVPFMCAQCEMAFADRTNYTSHLKSVHHNDKPFGCPQCPRSFSRRSDLRKHTIVHTGIKPFTCNICFKSFSRNTNLTKHLRIHSGHKPYVCPQCPKTFISKGDLTRHALIHSGQKPFACNYCEQSFGRRDKLLRHEKRHFPNGGEDRTSAVTELELLRQQIAFSGFTYESAVKQEDEEETEEAHGENWSGENMVINVDPFNHEENHELPPQIPEHITGDDTYTDYDNFKTQMDSSNDTMKKYSCFICHKTFASSDSLRFHATMHTGRKSHACILCAKAFLRKRELDRHMATHTGMKPFKCTGCEKRFGRKDKLVRHMRVHEPNVCALCGANFTRRDSLLAHIKNRHESSVDVCSAGVLAPPVQPPAPIMS